VAAKQISMKKYILLKGGHGEKKERKEKRETAKASAKQAATTNIMNV